MSPAPAPRVAEGVPPYSPLRSRRGSDLGRDGESAAARHLAALGCRILRRRYRTRAGEVDLIVEERGTLVFVEVKARSSLGCGRPSEAVDRRKRSRIARAAALYLLEEGGPDRPCRFDVVEVLERPDGGLCPFWIRDAFRAGE